MAISTEQMANALTRARYLMTPEAEKKMNESKGTSYVTDGGYGDYDIEYLTQLPQGMVMETQKVTPQTSKLPTAILESMMSTQIDVSSLNPDGMEGLMKKMNESGMLSNPAPAPIREEKVIPHSTNGVDYNMIRQIVEECIDKKLRELNENTLKGIRLKEGKIALVDHAGNIFNATLEYKGKSKK